MANLWRSRVVVSVGSAQALMTHYWDFGATASAAGATEALARVRAYLSAAAANINSVATATFNPVVDEIDSVTGTLLGSAVGSVPAAVAFTAGGDALPQQTQGLMTFTTSTIVNGRRLVGRQFLPFPSETQNVGALPTAGYVSTWNNAGAALGTVVVSTIAQQVWHRPVGGAGGQAAPVTGRVCGGTWAVLRSRRV